MVAVYHVAIGLLALVAPDTFFDQIGHYGVENSHYVGDVGAFILAFGVAIGIAVFRPAWRAPLLWLGALWYGFHAINHAFDTGEAKSEARGWADTLRSPSAPSPRPGWRGSPNGWRGRAAPVRAGTARGRTLR